MPIIDNENTILLDELKELLNHTERASIAVGYFFISGFAQIMDSLGRIEGSDDPDHVLRLLISPTTDRRTAEAMLQANESLRAAEREGDRDVPEEEALGRARDEVCKALEYMPQSEGDVRAVRKLIDLIRRKKVQVKVYTQDRLHAKAYIFDLDPSQVFRGAAIVGSSNLSISGIREHAELNLMTSHKLREGDHGDLLEWFDRHWNHPSCAEFTEEAAEILGRSWAGSRHTPKDVYGKAALHEHGDYDPPPQHDTGAEVELFDFQKKAVGEAIRKLDSYGGVIIADVVGTGKTYVGSAILKHLKEYHHAKPLVICPPHLRDMWQDHLRKFDIYGEVESRYKIGMGDDVLRNHTHCDTVLIDESHNFRHQHTNAYGALLAFMEDKTDEARVIMLTATPISNTIQDLKNQLRLFPAEGLERIPVLGTTKLDAYFKGLENPDRSVTPEGVSKIQDLLRHVLIRRVRGQIIDRYARRDGDRFYLEHGESRKYFPRRNLQNPSEYDADRVYNNSFEAIERAIGELRLARYVPGRYVREEFAEKDRYSDLVHISTSLAGIVRTSLLKRMESSIKAFDTSINNYQRGYRLFREQLDKGTVPLGKGFKDAIYSMADSDYDHDDFERDIAKIKPQYDIGAFDVGAWKDDIDSDLRKFAEIKGHLSGEEYTARDDKLHKLRDLVRGRDEKILVFSESAETARYVYDYLKAELPGRRIAQIDSKQNHKTKTLLVRRFDPEHNGAPGMPRGEQLDLLVSTDVISEGVNLHAGRTVINYDFHWNPVRLIQRVGRIDRIGSEHPVIDIFNFLPTTKIDAALSLRDRVANKIRTIRQIIGTDQKILEATEEIDEAGVSAIYGATDDSVLDPALRGGILDIVETDAEKHADDIRGDDGRKKYFEGLPFGIRAVAGSKRLLVACEAEDLLDRSGDKSRTTENAGWWRRYYEVAGDDVKNIPASSFLKQVGDNSGAPAGDEGPQYNEFVAKAWKEFNRDISNEVGRNAPRKHQQYFEGKLVDIATHNKDLADRARRLRPFVGSRMRHTHQPYRSLIDLHKRIDQDTRMGDEGVVAGLETIQRKYGDIHYERIIRKPRILYSLMVGT